MSVLLVLGLASLTRTLADGPSTETTESTTRSDGPSCGCSTTSFVLVYGESPTDLLIRKNDTSFGSATIPGSFTSPVSQDACEDALLLHPSAIAYSYVVLTQSCVLLSEISEAVSAPNTHSGAKIQDFPWLCHVLCTANADDRWTGVVRTSFYDAHPTPSCQCCYNEASRVPRPEVHHYMCSSFTCIECTGNPSSDATTSSTSLLQPRETWIWSWKVLLVFVAAFS
ncbi:unnamed protein product [Cladocopium goreaui]|uniref:Uncharacterized protein n=2 Tax=Cladocopium goreaui TaxID=2562237 RepID=A0A9P1FJF0_9DINO|nr:unnamed protein product [Cladocopium goreaui]